MPPMSAASIITYCWPRRVQSSASSSASTTAFRTWDQYSNLSTATRSPWFSKRSVRRAAKLHGTHASATSAIAAPCPHLPTRSTARIRTQARRCGPAFPAGREIFVVHTQKLRAALDEARLAKGRRRRPRSSRARPSRARGPRSRHRPGDDGQRSELQRLWRAARTAAIVRGRWTDGADGLREQRKPAAKQFHFRCHRFGFLRRGLFPACWQTTPRRRTPFLLLSL